MAKQLKVWSVLFDKKRTDHFDSDGWPYTVVLHMLPPFYFMEHGDCAYDPTYDNDCSYTHPYFQLRETRALEYPATDEGTSFDSEDDYEDELPLLGMEVDWEEHDRLEHEFELDREVKSDGFVIIALPDSVFAIMPWDVPDENEDTMLNGFDFETIDIPKVPIPCAYSKLS